MILTDIGHSASCEIQWNATALTALRSAIVAIGGINENNISELEGSGISGVSIISGIFAQEDVFSAAVRFKTLAEKIILKKPEGIL